MELPSNLQSILDEAISYLKNGGLEQVREGNTARWTEIKSALTAEMSSHLMFPGLLDDVFEEIETV